MTKQSKFTAILYFHGMGEQRHYEEVSRLVDALDAYDGAINNYDLREKQIKEIKARLEKPNKPIEGDVTYIEVGSAYRFYEVYWAPVAAGGSPPYEVFKWLLKQAFKPFETTRTPWRLRSRLRRSTLHSLWAKLAMRGKHDFQKEDMHSIARAYDEFERLDQRRQYRKGSFPEFVTYLETRYAKESDRQERLIKLAKHWRRFYVQTELTTGLTLLTLLIAIGLGVFGLLGGIFVLLNYVTASQLAKSLTEFGFISIGDLLEPTWKSILGIAVLLVSLFGITSFLRNYMGDVQLWTTYEETDEKHKKRTEILKRGVGMLMHVLRHDKCERIVIVAHSLGTAIAVDSLLRVGRYNRARYTTDRIPKLLELEKIEYLITFGSPIDKIHYFFESYRGKYHRYNRVVDQLRGDIGEVPFVARNGKPHIHWINFWDQGDSISGPLESCSNRKRPSLRTDNVQISNYLFPDPAACHGGYFLHKKVIGTLYDVIINRSYSFKNATLIPNQGYDYEALFLGPGKANRLTWFFQILMLLLPWLLLISGGLALLSILVPALPAIFDWLRIASFVLSGLVFVLLAFFWSISRWWQGHLNPFCEDGSSIVTKNQRKIVR